MPAKFKIAKKEYSLFQIVRIVFHTIEIAHFAQLILEQLIPSGQTLF